MIYGESIQVARVGCVWCVVGVKELYIMEPL